VLASCCSEKLDLQILEIQRIRQRLPGAKFVLIVDAPDAEGKLQLWPLIDGFVLRTVDAQALPKALELVLLGERVILGMVREMTVPARAQQSSGSFDMPHLSPREQDVLRSLSCGSSNKVIARDMGLSESTVKVHVKGILRKLNARNRTEAAVWARTNGFAPVCRPDAD
jgi:two-component system nitrate/nitrite response regulator NarL